MKETSINVRLTTVLNVKERSIPVMRKPKTQWRVGFVDEVTKGVRYMTVEGGTERTAKSNFKKQFLNPPRIVSCEEVKH